MRAKPSFIVVTATLCLLVLVAVCSQILTPLIPPARPNRLAREAADYLLQARTERIHWYAYSDAAFAEARRQDRPIFLAIGMPDSRYGREMDESILDATEVVNFVNQNFVAIRVDGLEHPDWVNNLLPLQRVSIGFTSDLQFWVLDPDGQVIDLLTKVAQSQPIDRTDSQSQRINRTEMVTLLAEARDDYNRLPRTALPDTAASTMQIQDLATLESKPKSVTSFSIFDQALVASTDPKDRGWPVDGTQVPRPQILRYLLLTGRSEAFQRQSGPLLHTGIFDMLDGGFFHLADESDWADVEFDKPAPENAELAEVFASAYAITRVPEYRYAAERTFDSLTAEFVSNGAISAARLGDEGPFDRSNRSSFSTERLAKVLPDPDKHAWAVSNFELNPFSNPQMTPLWINAAPITQADRCNAILTLMRQSSPAPRFASNRYADINALVVARLLTTARLLGSSERLAQALALVDGLERFRVGVDVVHQSSGPPSPELFLSDYLNYADASLQAYLATGHEDNFRQGLAVLNRGLALFAGRAPGELLLARYPAGALTPPYSAAPELVDNRQESCTAEAMRLCEGYALLASGDDAKRLHAFAIAALGQFGGVCNGLGPWAAGFYCSAAEMADTGYAVAVGSQADADALQRMRPVRFIGRAEGAIRPDLVHRGPGVYVVHGALIQGPMSPIQAAKLLGPQLRVE